MGLSVGLAVGMAVGLIVAIGVRLPVPCVSVRGDSENRQVLNKIQMYLALPVERHNN